MPLPGLKDPNDYGQRTQAERAADGYSITEGPEDTAAKHENSSSERPWELENQIREDLGKEAARRGKALSTYLQQDGIQSNLQQIGLAGAERGQLRGRSGGGGGNFAQRMVDYGSQGQATVQKAGQYGMEEAAQKRQMMLAENMSQMDDYLQAGDIMSQRYGGQTALDARNAQMGQEKANARSAMDRRQAAAAMAAAGSAASAGGSALGGYLDSPQQSQQQDDSGMVQWEDFN